MSTHNYVIDLSHLGLIAVQGSDAEKFLQGQLTCDVAEVTQQQSRLGAHCNPKGRIISNFRLFRLGESYYLQLPQSMLELGLANLRKYAIFYKVTLTDASQAVSSIGLTGTAIEAVLQQHFSSLPATTDSAINEHAIQLVKIPGITPRYQAIGEPAAISSLKQQLKLELQPNNHWDLLDIMAGIPSIYLATSELFTPHQINYQLLNGVNFKKGCYTGQEVIARMHYLGKLKQHMYQATIQSPLPPQPGDKIFASCSGSLRAVGDVVMVQQNAENYQALVSLLNQGLEAELVLEQNKDSQVRLLS